MLSISGNDCLYFDVRSIKDFCASSNCHGFMVVGRNYNNRENVPLWENPTLGENPLLGESIPLSPENFIAVTYREHRCAMIFAADRKGGFADRHLFPLFEKLKQVVYNRKKWEVVLSHYYNNPNSRHKVRHLILTRAK